MSKDRIVLQGIPAWLGSIDGPKKCAIWVKDPNEVGFDPAKLVPIDDLVHVPKSARQGKIKWEDVRFDDDVKNNIKGKSTVGMSGELEGGIYVEEEWLKSLRASYDIPGARYYFQQASGDYEFQNLLTVAGGVTRRFLGFYAKVIRDNAKNVVNVQLYRRGYSLAGLPWAELPMDILEDSNPASPVDKQMSEVTLDPAQDAGSLFLAEDYIQNLPDSTGKKILLGDPKLPKGTGFLGGWSKPPRSVKLPHECLADGHLNVSVCTSEQQLLEVQAQINGVIRISTLQDLERLIDALDNCREKAPPDVTLDLIAHSMTVTENDGSVERYLLLGDCLISKDNPAVQQFAEGYKTWLERLHVKRIRLLGCSTGTTEGAKDTMIYLAKKLGVEVAGTTGILSAVDFDENGLNTLGIGVLTGTVTPVSLTDASRQPPRMGDGSKVKFDLEKFELRCAPRHYAPWPSRRLDERLLISQHLSNGWTSAPGLLTVPDVELLHEFRPGSGLYERMDVLLDYRLVRIFPLNYPEGLVSEVDADNIASLKATIAKLLPI